tara:strand:+ start:310 stop:1053 length:744 start_codon:yes stop_codon:yes gene_type:complete
MIKDKQLNFGSYSLFSTLKSVALIVALIIMAKMYFGERDSRIEQQTLIEASADELKTWKNKDGENLAKIQVLETRNEKTFLAFKSQDSTIQQLQKLVRSNRSLFKNSRGTAGIIKSETKIDTIAPTTVTKDTENNPIYTAFIKDKWYNINSVATKDSTRVKLNTFHNISLVMGSEGKGFLKKKKSFATAKDDNPYSNIKDMRIYNVTEDIKHFVIGPYAGFGATIAGPDIKIGWQIGFGVTYKLFEF